MACRNQFCGAQNHCWRVDSNNWPHQQRRKQKGLVRTWRQKRATVDQTDGHSAKKKCTSCSCGNSVWVERQSVGGGVASSKNCRQREDHTGPPALPLTPQLPWLLDGGESPMLHRSSRGHQLQQGHWRVMVKKYDTRGEGWVPLYSPCKAHAAPLSEIVNGAEV